MGLGQTMITSAFLVLLTIAAMTANKMIVDRDTNYYEQEAYRQAALLANSLLSEIVKKKFDEAVDTSDSGYLTPSAFTSSSNLGTDDYLYFGWWLLDEGDFISNPDVVSSADNPRYDSINDEYFDDVDDYDGYVREAQSAYITGFELTVRVYYVNGSDLDTETLTQTYFKRIEVTVKNTTYFPKRDYDGDGSEDDDLELTFSTIKSY